MKKFLKFTIISLIFPIVLIIKILNIKIGFIRSSRIGHLTTDTEIFIILKKKKIINSVDIIFYDTNNFICNKFLFNIIKNKIKIVPLNKLFVDLFNFILTNFNVRSQIQKNNSKYFYLFKTEKPFIDFTAKQKEYGDSLLREMGIQKNDKFICIHNRDSSYLNQSYFSKQKFNYHHFRNFNIDDLNKSLKFCISQGFKVFRMGQKQSEKISLISKDIIDYAFAPLKSDFMDVYISSKCEFYFGSCSGYWGLPNLFRKKLYFINQIEDMISLITKNDGRKYIFKKIYDNNDQRYLSLSEIISIDTYKIFNDAKYKARYSFINNTPIEILDFMKEAIYDIEKYNKGDRELNKKVFKVFSKFVNFKFENIDNRISENFLRKNLHLIR